MSWLIIALWFNFFRNFFCRHLGIIGLFCHFILEIRKIDREQYQRYSLTSTRFIRIRGNNGINNLIDSHEFANYHQVWRLKGKNLLRLLPGVTIPLVLWASVIFWKLVLHSFSLTVIQYLSNVTSNDKVFSFFLLPSLLKSSLLVLIQKCRCVFPVFMA